MIALKQVYFPSFNKEKKCSLAIYSGKARKRHAPSVKLILKGHDA